MSGLTTTELEILRFEGQWWQRPGAKEQAVADRFGLSATRYYQVLTRLLDEPAALAAEPQVVNRLRAMRDRKARQRVRPSR